MLRLSSFASALALGLAGLLAPLHADETHAAVDGYMKPVAPAKDAKAMGGGINDQRAMGGGVTEQRAMGGGVTEQRAMGVGVTERPAADKVQAPAPTR